MNIGILSVGLASAQGGTKEILSRAPLTTPSKLPWKPSQWTTCHLCRPAQRLTPSLIGRARWKELAHLALQDCLNGVSVPPGTPLILASSNGVADQLNTEAWNNSFDTDGLLGDTPWKDQALPMVSGSCASGLQALYLARHLLAAGHDQVFVLAADILSRANHENFEALRLLSSSPAPWQTANTGFLPGEAAVALHLTKGTENATPLYGPLLDQDFGQDKGFNNALLAFSTPPPELVIGQGSGPEQIDSLELCALKEPLDLTVPLTTPLSHFGHTNGVSGLLSAALASLMHKNSAPLSTLSMNHPSASDGRLLASTPAFRDTMVICRALSGARAIARVGGPSRSFQPQRHDSKRWASPAKTQALLNPTLRHIWATAPKHRPFTPPDLLIVTLNKPIRPPTAAQIGGRLLPSAILEITPGFIPQLIACCWGYTGAALCIVGNENARAATNEMIQACRASGLMVSLVQIHGSGEERDVEWNS